MVKAGYSVDIKNHSTKICFGLYYNVANSFLYANGVKIHQFKAKDSEMKIYPLCLGNVSPDSTIDNINTKTGL